jgi:hypothetical protein
MIGPHDLGGTSRHGAVVVEMEEPVFHAPWEGKMFALNILAGNWTPPEFRSVLSRCRRLNIWRHRTTNTGCSSLNAIVRSEAGVREKTSDRGPPRLCQQALRPRAIRPCERNKSCRRC